MPCGQLEVNSTVWQRLIMAAKYSRRALSWTAIIVVPSGHLQTDHPLLCNCQGIHKVSAFLHAGHTPRSEARPFAPSPGDTRAGVPARKGT